MERTLWMIDLKCCLHRGHSALILLHSSKHLKQNWCRQESVKHLFLHLPRQMAQFGGGDFLSSSILFSISGTFLSPTATTAELCPGAGEFGSWSFSDDDESTGSASCFCTGTNVAVGVAGHASKHSGVAGHSGTTLSAMFVFDLWMLLWKVFFFFFWHLPYLQQICSFASIPELNTQLHTYRLVLMAIHWH